MFLRLNIKLQNIYTILICESWIFFVFIYLRVDICKH